MRKIVSMSYSLKWSKSQRHCFLAVLLGARQPKNIYKKLHWETKGILNLLENTFPRLDHISKVGPNKEIF
jgi:hypothetical protein